ncbi:MAG: aromatic amino acid lyase [Alphaproteobacteria bacterium]|nr:aromatic amino acid lyase [Alphaproteobacteria bacterium]
MTKPSPPLNLGGQTLTCEALEAAAYGCPKIGLAEAGLTRMAASRAIIDDVIERKVPVYGVTTGLGALANTALGADQLAAYSEQTVRGRAHAAGPLLPAEQVRAALLVRLNTLLIGASGAQPSVAHSLKAALEAGLTPAVGEYGSIGASDLILGATAGLALIGEGHFLAADGAAPLEAAEALQAAGLAPLQVGPRDGLALANHAGFSAGLCALGVAGAARVFNATQTAAAVSMEGFRANLSPFDERVIKLRGQDGEAEAARGILDHLEGSTLFTAGQARRLQDPLSIRNIPQIHGLVLSAMANARSVVETELNGSSDNPATLTTEGEILSSGNYLTPHLTSAAETLSRAFVHLATAQVARMAKLLSEQFTGLPLFLAAPGSVSSGFAPVIKVAEALLTELTAAARPTPIWSSACADGVEDVMSSSFSAARALLRVTDLAGRLSAMELMLGAQCVELRELDGKVAPAVALAIRQVRAHSPALAQDRPLTDDINALTSAVAEGAFNQPQ